MRSCVSQTESSSTEDSDEEGQPARKPSRKAAAAAAPVAAGKKKKDPAAEAAAEAAAAAAAQAQLLDMFGSFVPPAAAAPAPAAKASKKSRAPPPPVEESEDESEESSEEEEAPPPPKKKASKKAAAAAAAAEPVAAAAAPGARECSVADCGQPRVKRGYCAQHLNDPSAPSTGARRSAPAARGGHDDDDAPQSMASFLGDESEEALAGFGGLAVSKGGANAAAGPRKIKRNPAAAAAPAAAAPARRPVQQQQPQQRYVDPGLDGEYDEDQAAAAGADYYDNPPPAIDGEYEDGDYTAGSPQSPPLGGGPSKSYNPALPKNPKDWRIDFENTSTSLGMNKNIVVWNFVWKRTPHQVELHHSTFGGKRKVIVDGRVRVQEKKPFADQSRYDLRIGEGPLAVNIGVQIRAAGLTAFTYELYVERHPYDQAQKFWLSHPEV